MNKDTLLVFGGGSLQVSLINNALELGYYVIVIDPDEKAIGKAIASKFVTVDGSDYEKTLQIAKDYRVKGIVTAATDKPLLMMARVAQEMGLSFPTYDSILNTIDKSRFKSILLKNALACAKGNKYTSDNVPKAKNIEYPVIIKPTNNSGSRGVVFCDNSETFNGAVTEAFLESKGEILIEEYIEGDEISVEALVFDNDVHILQITDKVITKAPYNVEVSQMQPSKYHDSHFGIIQLYLQELIDVLGLNNCAIHPEFKINEGGVFLLEMGPRLGGDFITSHLVPLSTGINMETALIKIATRTQVDILRVKNKAAEVKYFNFSENFLVKNNLDVSNFYKNYSKLVLLETTLRKGDRIKKITNSLNRYGHFISQDDNEVELAKTSDRILERIINKLLD